MQVLPIYIARLFEKGTDFTMTQDNTKLEMQSLLKECLEKHSFDALTQCLSVYEKTFGQDAFYQDIANSYIVNEPLLSLICLNVNDEYIEKFLATQNYSNIELVKVDADDTYEDICAYFRSTESSYICFLEPNQRFEPNALVQMVKYLSKKETEMVITARNYMTPSGIINAHADYLYQSAMKNRIFSGKEFFTLCLEERANLFGILSTLMVSTSYAKTIPWDLPNYEYDEIMKFAMLSQFIIHGSFGYIDTPLVTTQVQEYRDESHLQRCFEQYILELNRKGLISVEPDILYPTPVDYTSIQKHITFFYTDKGEYYNLKPIADEAERRGYTVEFTENIMQKAEIGVYCQHICHPENSKFSLILLHDMAQGHNRWPNIWEIERWNHFDLGIVPGDEWANRWSECACHYYVNPRLGTYCWGYPKSDLISSNELEHRAQELREQFQLKYNFSVLYAPSWENDEKEDDFVRALASLPVNLLIKQAHWSAEYPHIIENIRQMRTLHEGKYDNVYYIEPEESILTALELCDMVVSEESSVMTEAILFNKPSVAVYDWLVPDTLPSRFASVPMEYVLKCKRVELREYVENLSSNPDFYAAAQAKFSDIFSNQGNVCKDILDAIDYYTQEKTDCDFMNKKLSSKYTTCSMWN